MPSESFAADYRNVTELGRWFLDSQAFTAEQLMDYFDRPWRWQHEWEHYLAAHGKGEQPPRHKNCDLCAEVDELSAVG